ncbi:hypothetical protein PM082_014971 [Marasmius tenuissimus]|nr:hypothetical protein PM082_014971 [Marasmius tenuissimus]
MLRYVHSKDPDHVPDVSGIALDCINAPIDLEWARHTVYYKYDRAALSTDSREHWKGNPVHIC